MDYRFTRIFVRASDRRTVAGNLAELLDGRLVRQALEFPEAFVEIRQNSDAGLADDFIGWPVTIEIDAEPGATEEAIVALVSRIVTGLWERGAPAVAACDFEERLPWKGGIARLDGMASEED